MSPRSPSPLSEGEIVSGDEEKAISTNTYTARDSKVNMSARLPPASSSRASRLDGLSSDMDYHFRDDDDDGMRPRRDRVRSRSPYRAAKPASGDKRRHDDDHYSRKGASDPRRFKVHYEGRPSSRDATHHSRRPYEDLDRPDQPKGHLPYDDRSDRSRESSHRTGRERGRDRERSRSPFRHSKTSPHSDQRNGSRGTSNPKHYSSHSGNENDERRRAHTPIIESESTPETSRGTADAKVKLSLSQHAKQTSDRGGSQRSAQLLPLDEIQADDSQSTNGLDKPVQQAEENESQAQLSEADLIEQRRKRREAIKAKHKNEPSLLVQALEQNMPSAPATPLHDSSSAPSEQHSPPTSMESPRTPQRISPPDSPAAFVVNNDDELMENRNADNVGNDEEGPSAADYDPNLDMEEDRPDFKKQEQQADAAAAAVGRNDSEQPPHEDSAPKQAKEFDMFADEDDDDDMFAPNDSKAKPVAASTKEARALDESLLDNWDYPDGHYRIILGELLDGRYAVQQQIGKGTFATVVRAQDTRTGNVVAVKIACNNETMYKAGQKEMDMLQLLNQHDPEDKKHIIRLLRHFDHKGHLCLVFENLSADLREVLKKFGRNVGINLKAIRSYAQQMFLSLSLLKKCQILHADLKPDNILVSEKRNLLKICDLGTAAFAHDAEVTPYLVSRFYRAPEVILGMPFEYAIDMWSIGCTLFELYTGRILFAGADNNQMLRAIQECRGKFPIRMLKRATLAEKHFDFDGNFFSQERDKITGKATIRQMNFTKTAPGKDLRSRLSGNTKGMKPEEIREHAAFVDLMDKCLQLDPLRRISPNEALRHNFIAHAMAPPAATEKASSTVKVAMKVPRRG